MSEGAPPLRPRVRPPRRPLPDQEPQWARDLSDRLTDIEMTLIVLKTQFDFQAEEAKEQKVFRKRVYWAGLMVVGLLVLDHLGFDVSVIK